MDWDERAFLSGVDRGIAEYEAMGARALDALADGVVARAQGLAPVDTGELRESIAKRASGKDSDGPFVDVGTTDEVGIYQEYGTVNMPAHPFMRPAFAEAPAKFGDGLR